MIIDFILYYNFHMFHICLLFQFLLLHMWTQWLSHVWLCNPMDCSPTDSSLHGIFPERILEWAVIFSSKGSSWDKDKICSSCISCITGGFFTVWANREAALVYTIRFNTESYFKSPCYPIFSFSLAYLKRLWISA